MAFHQNGAIAYHQQPVGNNGYISYQNQFQPPQANFRPIQKSGGKHEDEEAGKLFVGGLSWDTTQDSLLAYFSQFGDVIDCVVMKNCGTNRSRGFGFVTFADPSKIEAVLSRCPHSLDGRTIDPKACNPRSMQKPKKSNGFPKIFLGGLPSTITETDLRNYFSRYGEVCEVVIMYDQEKKKSRGFGFLSFGDEMARERAVAEHFVNIQNKQVEIKRAEPRTIPHNGTSLPVKDFTQPPPVEQQSNWGVATISNGHAPIGVHHLHSPNTSYPPQYGSPPAQLPWPHAAPPPQQATPTIWRPSYASPPPPTPFYPAPAATPTTTFYSGQQTSQYGAPNAAYSPQYPNMNMATPPTKYSAEYFPSQATPTMIFNNNATGPPRGAVFATTQQQPPNNNGGSAQNYHPYRRQV